MLVRATQRGFYLSMRDPGEEFHIPEDGKLFASSWMEKVGPPPKPVVRKSASLEPGETIVVDAQEPPK